jgi:hypothetical protein
VAANAVPSDLDLTTRVAAWAYDQAEGASALVWSHGRDGMIRLDSRWRGLLVT